MSGTCQQTFKKKRKQTPLAYMLDVMNDPSVPEDRRDRMAMAAAPYCHPKLTDSGRGKKQQQTEAANTAAVGTPWARDIEPEIHPN